MNLNELAIFDIGNKLVCNIIKMYNMYQNVIQYYIQSLI